MAAFSVVELMFVLGIAATLASLVVPSLRAGLDDMRAVTASRHVMARLQQARGRAVMRGRATAVRFTPSATGYVVSMYEDENGNGVLAADIATGIDALVMPIERLTEQMPGTDFGALPGLPGAEGSTAPGADPIRLGSSDGVTFTADGTATSGSLYLLGSGGAQYVVRIYGETGRTRILKFHRATGLWAPL